ncbi:hypothetical protein BN159_2590 [Streptomyces davaonensis JCM 4913]|uniref:Uncharacterized protein n=1 Tax=Streptomyces davaonensis (strain DSM 101723 / JCM 4913 / KCC S-0913 / 768) TaxID=1214101 RepID=K4R2S0_STRDJ|nr:hypothetical protein [Streptomyces davaonensis]CCK26969.1 hypothetical protein BN159_2590 [Streptomyces davaonensis JCM 4913]
MTGSTSPWKRRFPARGADQGPPGGPDGARDDERGSSGIGSASLEPAAGPGDLPVPAQSPAPVARRRAAVMRDKAREGVRKGGSRAKAGLAYLADRIIENAPRVPVRDLATLRRQFPGLGPEQLADKLVAGAMAATSTVGAGIGAAAMLPVPPAMPAELATEITGVAAIELKLIAELHEVYGVRPPGNLKQRSTAYLDSWSGERGIDVTRPSTVSSALNSHMKHQLRQQIMKRMVRNLPNLMPFMVGAAVGALMNRRDTRKLADRIRADLRKIQVPWDALAELPALEAPADPLTLGEVTGEVGRKWLGRGRSPR